MKRSLNLKKNFNFFFKFHLYLGHEKKILKLFNIFDTIGIRKNIGIFSLQSMLAILFSTKVLLKSIIFSKGKILFVGSRLKFFNLIRLSAIFCDEYYITIERWIPGTLTNFFTIKDYYKKNNLLETNIWTSSRCPSLIICFNVSGSENIIKEAHKLNIPIIGIVDSDANSNWINYSLFGNDDSIVSVKFYTLFFNNLIVALKKTKLNTNIQHNVNYYSKIQQKFNTSASFSSEL